MADNERLAVLETDIKYIKEGQDEIKTMLQAHIEAQCTGSCDTAKDVVALKATIGTYKKWTWATFASVCLAGFAALFK
jgi:hypothetical protein